MILPDKWKKCLSPSKNLLPEEIIISKGNISDNAALESKSELCLTMHILSIIVTENHT